MKILVCFKFIQDENEIVINPDRTLDLSAAAPMISPYDLNAIEAAMKLSGSVNGSSVCAITVGGEVVENSKMKKGVLSRGPEKLYAIRNDNFMSDNYSTALLLKLGIERIGDVDLVICGEGSGDMYSQQLGNLLGALLGWTTLNAVNKLSYADGLIIAERCLESKTEVFSVRGPAVISVTSDISLSHIPSMKDILSAGKKPAEVWNFSELSEACESMVEVLSTLAPEHTERRQEIFTGNDEGIEQFCLAIKKCL
ncbi:MAG: electron transfer flavoprotein [Oscillospiraceae bacterium]